jgi:single-stranded-DNA-specific exonuclease
VIGIVASRLVEKYNRPVVMIAGTEGEWKGSGRSVPAFDLHGGLGACSAHLERYGGHRAAAGLTIAPERVETFAAAFAAHADEVLTEDDLRPVTRIDAIVPGSKLTLSLSEELNKMAPFGIGNPGVMLLVDGCEIADASTVGDGKHLRFRVRQHGRDSGQAIAFNLGAQLDRFRRDQRYDVAFRLQENRWNGVVSPQLVVRRVFDAVDGFKELREWLGGQWREGEAAWTSEARAIFEELELAEGAKRSLLESQAFRELLEARPVLAAAA